MMSMNSAAPGDGHRRPARSPAVKPPCGTCCAGTSAGDAGLQDDERTQRCASAPVEHHVRSALGARYGEAVGDGGPPARPPGRSPGVGAMGLGRVGRCAARHGPLGSWPEGIVPVEEAWRARGGDKGVRPAGGARADRGGRRPGRPGRGGHRRRVRQRHVRRDAGQGGPAAASVDAPGAAGHPGQRCRRDGRRREPVVRPAGGSQPERHRRVRRTGGLPSGPADRRSRTGWPRGTRSRCWPTAGRRSPWRATRTCARARPSWSRRRAAG